MPIYVYETIPAPGESEERFEVTQRMSDPPLTVHPTTGRPVRRVICAPFVGRAGGADPGFSDARAERAGFSKYVNRGDGTFDRAYGGGPDRIRR